MSSTEGVPPMQRGITLLQGILSLVATILAIGVPISAAIYRQTLMLERHDWWIIQHTAYTEKRNDYLDSVDRQQEQAIISTETRLIRIETKLDQISQRVK